MNSRGFCTQHQSAAGSGPHMDDEFVFPVHASGDAENMFLWSGVIIHNQVCNLDSDDFSKGKKSILVNSKNVVLLRTEHRTLGVVSFVGIKSDQVKDWRFCSIAVHGDELESPDDSAMCEDHISSTIKDFISALFAPALKLGSIAAKGALMGKVQAKFLTLEYLVGNFPHHAGHFKFPKKSHSSVSVDVDIDPSIDDLFTPASTLMDGAQEPSRNGDACDWEHWQSILNPASALQSTALLGANTTCKVLSVTPVLMAESSAWTTVDLGLSTGLVAADTTDKELYRSSTTKLLVQLLMVEKENGFEWKICNVLCIDP